ncbi:MAG TPA: D-alanyl-D-alanine carboxypeptidase/D-alanyl-D-alanine-endopeptidase, partial [Myxococcaceae bacterium]|nr:D-alanyl-D-alanine carboxypeptidase/D-alanyl-D-alanine-endopeptidase [Myxococcaceae bacterium]
MLSWLLTGAAVAGAPAGTSKTADREALRKTLTEVLQRPALQAARVSAQVVSLDTGETIFAQKPDDLLNPASNVKLFTGAASLLRLGPEYRFDTEFLADSDVGAGRLKALYVRGKGDPFLSTERLYGIVSELKMLGIREVGGDVVVDDTWFDGDRLAPGYEQEDTDRAYMAPTGAVSLNGNVVGVYVRPGNRPGEKATVSVEPPSDFFTITNALTTWDRKNKRFWVTSDAAGDKQQIAARGVVPAGTVGQWAWKKIDNPPMYFGHTLKMLLEERGVKVRGKVKLGVAPANARLLHVARSETLDLILKRLNKNSSNFVAEQLLKTLGAEVRGAPGNFAKGIDVVEEVLEKEIGIPRGGYVMRNGSGLNDTNRFTVAQLNRLLKAMYDRFPLAPEYLSSLGIAGKDGTLRFRFEGSEAVGRLRAKTGTLQGVTALS